MKRTDLSLTDEQYEWVRNTAFKQGESISSLFRSWIDTMKTGNDIMDDLKQKKDSDVGKAYTEPKKISETPKEVGPTDVIPPTNLASNLYRNQIVNPAPKPKGKE